MNNQSALITQNATLPPLPYAYNALEPYISGEIMKLHHDKHHKAYVTNLNNALIKQEAAFVNNDVKEQINLQSQINFNGGGHINHSLFWKSLAPANSTEAKINPSLKCAISRQFGSYEKFQEAFSKKLLGIQGSGWAWLVKQDNGVLTIETTKDQDPILVGTPLLGVDMWEHAYYLQYQNDKTTYVKNIYNVVNWHEVESRFNQSSARLL